MKYFLVLLCFQRCLIGVLSDGVNGGNQTNLLLRPAERACNAILSDDDDERSEFSWMATLGYVTTDFKISFRCSGTIISKHFVLTVAHCLSSNHPVLVRLGKVTDDDYDRSRGYHVKEVIEHPNYSYVRSVNDIALIRLTNPIQFRSDIAPACLNTNKNDLGDLIVTGLVTIYSESKVTLLKAHVKTVPLSECNATFVEFTREYHLAFLRNGLNEGQYCAHEPDGKKDSPHANSGSPLQYFPNNSTTANVVGIASFGVENDNSFPVVYTRVSHYLDWIESIVWPSDQ